MTEDEFMVDVADTNISQDIEAETEPVLTDAEVHAIYTQVMDPVRACD